MRPPRKRKVVSSNLTGGCAIERLRPLFFLTILGMAGWENCAKQKIIKNVGAKGELNPRPLLP